MAEENENNEDVDALDGEDFDEFDLQLMLNDFGGISNMLNNMMNPPSSDTWPDDYDTALQWIEEGKDPFRHTTMEEKTAFHLASHRGDLKLLLHMAAKPGTTWAKQFMFCCGKEIDAPVRGRECISSGYPFSSRGHFFHMGLSLEGIEVMLMYGYKIMQRDIETICGVVSTYSHFSRSLLFALANTDRDEMKLEQCLGLAIGGAHFSFINNKHASSLDLAKILLAAGADPNGYCFQGGTPYDFTPALYQAVKNQDEDMVKLLMKYGADPTKTAQVSTSDENGELHVEYYSITTLAEENGMLDLLVPPETSAVVDVEVFLQKIRHDFSAPLRAIISGLIAVAMMRVTGETPPPGVISCEIISFCNFFYN